MRELFLSYSSIVKIKFKKIFNAIILLFHISLIICLSGSDTDTDSGNEKNIEFDKWGGIYNVRNPLSKYQIGTATSSSNWTLNDLSKKWTSNESIYWSICH